MAFEHVQAVFRKGRHAAAYSGFEGFATQDGNQVALAQWLRNKGIEQVEVAGLATDHCVRATALDACKEGFETTVLLELTAGVAPETVKAALTAMREAGIHLVGEQPM
jgi:nicotinamidase/pyrazinamidase